MTSAACPRQFEAEAMRDGRLTGAELAAFTRHMHACATCSSEVEALERLAEAIRASVRDHAGADELRVRRERTRLLAAFDQSLVSSERRSAKHRWLPWSAAAAAMVFAGLFVFWRARASVHPVPASNVVIRADSTAVWSRHTQAGRERIVLERGALFVHVDHSVNENRLVVALPDGELEDIGTTFSVSAQDGHTARVAVQEGSVVLRIRDKAPVALGPGEAWTVDPPPAPARMDAPAPAPAPVQTVQRPRPTAARPSTRLHDPPSAALDFNAAMAAFDRGDCRPAASGFAEFILAHPADPRAEDAAYLRVMSFHKCGDESSMKVAALQYVQRYPTGFRRVEVERLAR